jgi:class 3 adenylate cyclase
MDERPITRHAKAPDGVSISYQVSGQGPLDVVFLAGLGMPIDLLWDEPGFARFAMRLGRFSRIVWSDARGVGASGGDLRDGAVDEICDGDLAAVVDAVGSERVALVGAANSGATAVRYAARNPERVRALVLINTFACYIRDAECPWGFPPDALDRFADDAQETWGTSERLEIVAPSKAADEGFQSWWARSHRLVVGPDQVAAWVRALFEPDVRAVLPDLAVPVLILHRRGNRFIQVGAGRYLAEHIPGAKYLELPGDDHVFFVGDTDTVLDEVEEFLTGTRQAPEGDVATATILFTDIVSSTEQSARLGHRKWTTLTDAHDDMVRRALARHRGREIKTIGDGFLATFDATTRAARAAMEIVSQARTIGLEVRAGVHAGEVEVRPNDVVGLAVSVAKRICDLAGPGQVLASDAVKALLTGSNIVTVDEGTYPLKGVPGEWRLFALQE